MATANGTGELDPVLRHACLTGLDRLGTVEAAVAKAGDPEREVRLMALLYLRRHESPEAVQFLGDTDSLIRREAVRAIYDTKAMDGPAGDVLAAHGVSAFEFPEPVQRRIVAANYRRGQAQHARMLMQMASEDVLAPSVREAAFHALRLWEDQIETDPVLGHYRPLPAAERSMEQLGSAIERELKQFLADNHPPNLTALALKLADESGVALEPDTLRMQVANAKLDPEIRVAAFDSLVKADPDQAKALVPDFLADPKPLVQAAAIRHGFALQVEGMADVGRTAIRKAPLVAAREAITGLVALQPEEGMTLWAQRGESNLRPELWLDLYLALQASSNVDAKNLVTAFAATDTHAVHSLSAVGGDPAQGEVVFRNQGACLQCHKIGSDGGIQGPALTRIGERLAPAKLVEAVVNPNAEITKGFGMSTVTLKDGTVLVGRIAKQNPETMTVVALDGKSTDLQPDQVQGVTPPVSAMPPLGASLPPRDLRNLIAYLANLKSPKAKAQDKASHGDDEKIAK